MVLGDQKVVWGVVWKEKWKVESMSSISLSDLIPYFFSACGREKKNSFYSENLFGSDVKLKMGSVKDLFLNDKLRMESLELKLQTAQEMETENEQKIGDSEKRVEKSVVRFENHHSSELNMGLKN